MPVIDLDVLRGAVTAGGPSALSCVTPLRPAAGAHAAVAPAKFASSERGVDSALGTYVYDIRFVDGERVQTVLVDSSQSQSNRIEDALDRAITEGHEVLGRIPRIRVTYQRDGVSESYTDLTLPHRAWDGHIRAGQVNGVEVTENARYRAARDANPVDASALYNLSPVSLVFGSWDATRKARQGRWASLVTGEIIGILTDQERDASRAVAGKGGARVDPVGMSVQLDGDTLMELAEAQRDELSAENYRKIAEKVVKAKKTKSLISAAGLGLGGIPPTLSALGGVSCRQIIRSRVVSFAMLRQIRFGLDADGDAACRAALAALAINGIVRADAELVLRAHCHLVEDGPTLTEIDRRHGLRESLDLPSIEDADRLLADAIDHAESASGFRWDGQIFEVAGNPKIVEGRRDDAAEGN